MQFIKIEGVTQVYAQVYTIPKSYHSNPFKKRNLKVAEFLGLYALGDQYRYKCHDRSAEYSSKNFITNIQELLRYIQQYSVFEFQTPKQIAS